MQYPEKMHVSNLAIKFLDTYGCLKKVHNSSKISPTYTDGIIWLHFADFSIWIRVGKTGSLGPCSRVIVYFSKLSFCQNDPPMGSAKVQWYNANNLSKIKTKKCQIVILSYSRTHLNQENPLSSGKNILLKYHILWSTIFHLMYFKLKKKT